MAYSEDHDLRDLCQKVILENAGFQHLKDCRIAVLRSDKDKKSNGKTVFADTEKLNDKHCLMTGYDFVITFYAACSRLSQKAMYILAAHELSHVGFEMRPGGPVKSIIPHDVEDFRFILERFGVDWIHMRD